MKGKIVQIAVCTAASSKKPAHGRSPMLERSMQAKPDAGCRTGESPYTIEDRLPGTKECPPGDPFRICWVPHITHSNSTMEPWRQSVNAIARSEDRCRMSDVRCQRSEVRLTSDK